MSIQVNSIDVYAIHKRLSKDKSKEGKEVWNYVQKLNEALAGQHRLTGEAIAKIRKLTESPTPGSQGLREALGALVNKYIANKGTTDEFVICITPKDIPDYWKTAMVALASPASGQQGEDEQKELWKQLLKNIESQQGKYAFKIDFIKEIISKYHLIKK